MIIKSREEFPELLNNINAKIGVELGVLKGEFSKVLLEKWNGDKLYLIDHWRTTPNLIDQNNGDHNTQLDNLAHTFMESYFYFDKCCIIKETSIEASKFFKDESIDFVYIDAAHDFKNVFNDIKIWYPKVKKEGIISGHDYITGSMYTDFGNDIKVYTVFEVKDAVDKFFEPLRYKINSTKDHPDCTETHPTWWVIK